MRLADWEKERALAYKADFSSSSTTTLREIAVFFPLSVFWSSKAKKTNAILASFRIGIMASTLQACPDSEIHKMVAEWADMKSEAIITPGTKLDGLNGMSWPEDAPKLIEKINEQCGIEIPKEDYELFARVEDIDDYVGDDLEEEKY